MAGERLRERLGVAAGLCHAKAHIRARGGRRISDQRNPPVHELWRRKVVDRGEERPHMVEAVQKLRRHDLFCIRAHLRNQVLRISGGGTEYSC
jgi:hypothetical protein